MMVLFMTEGQLSTGARFATVTAPVSLRTTSPVGCTRFVPRLLLRGEGDGRMAEAVEGGRRTRHDRRRGGGDEWVCEHSRVLGL